ncbi:MAG: hypothetical protein PHQ74_00870 [Crocinitomicaceae bacterium]|nr:hypothetical protein [Crocinitomicaceae bacterium]
MKSLVLVVLLSCFNFGFSMGQYKDYNCNSIIKDAQKECIANYSCYTADSLISKADYYSQNPPDSRCLNHYSYFVLLSDFYLSAVNSRNCSQEQMFYSWDKAVELLLKAGEIKPEYLQKNSDGAQRLMYIYSSKSTYYFDLKNQEQYDLATFQLKYWTDLYNGPSKQIDHTKPPNTTVYAKKDTLPGRPIVSQPIEKRFISKHIVVLAQNKKQIIDRKSELKPLTDEHLSIHFDSDIQITLSDKPSRYKYKLLFEENVEHRFHISYPGYEEQFLEYKSTQSPNFDTLFVIMYPIGTPLYYTKSNKRSFTLDSTYITIFPFTSRNKEFNLLIDELGLMRIPNSNNYQKKSGEAFDAENDNILEKLRSYSTFLVSAGHRLGRNTLLTNQLRIVWNKEITELSEEEQKEIDSILQKYQLKQVSNDLYAAPLGIGFYLNTIVEELNQLQIVRSAYPETYQLLSY